MPNNSMWARVTANKYLLFPVMFILCLTFQGKSLAGEHQYVYTIGAYDEAFAKHATVTKLGPIPAKDVPAMIPKSFLEIDGSYAGGEVFFSIRQACRVLHKQLEAGVLPRNVNWHIYLLDANWNRDTYKLHLNDFRIKHSVRVEKLVIKNCDKQSLLPLHLI